ncbi:uncharacterized protein [Nicotiana sylvestris]|uniref:Protein SET-like n=2 Tax=Nicotiana TaxID=4085 RepID=A0A1S3XHD5_TOBAC|nr:PREDICTED: protein SET-like isoform X1 [Nicotiana sylvestris]XP_009780777.1 PREDICTED: protein SET-like isoform X1 [Nicotiana sylvestris]XP_016439308.1 PREDICTED: protein SET-like [Nicotiana tabacum]
MEAYGGGQSSSNNEESTQGYNSKRRDLELATKKRLEKNKMKQTKNKKRRVIEELVECSGNNKEKDELVVRGEHQCVLTTSLDYINYNVLDWESVMTNMEVEVNFVLKTMVQLLGVNKEVALLQFELLLRSLHIRKDYILLVLKALKKEYVSEEEEYEVLKKMWDEKMEHARLISDEHFNLIKMGEEKGNKKQKMAEKAEDEENNQLVLCIEKLQDIQDKLEKINEEARDEVLKIAQKFSQLRKPVYEKRNDIIKTIPNFWLTAFLRHPFLGNLVSTEEDHKTFKYLSSIEVEDTEDFKSGYTITFYFSPNPFFENTMLSKTYTFLEDGRPTKVTASTVQWTEGNGVAPLAEERSFFLWFSSEVNQKYDEVAAIIKDELWPNPLNYFNEDDEEKDLHEADNGGDEIVNDSEDDSNEEADEEDVEAADEEVVKDSENDGDEEADEEDLEAAGGSGNEVVKDSEDDDEEADEEDLEAADEAGEGTENEGSYDDYDLGGG